MKITDWAIIFVLIVGPLLWISSWDTEHLREANRLQIRYTASLRTAAQDAGVSLNRNELQAYESGYRSDKFMRADKEAALSVLMNTLGINFGIIDDPLALKALMLYIPAVVVIDYDGYFIYAMEESTGEDGDHVEEHRWRPKKPFIYRDSDGNSLAFTLDQQITVIDPVTGERVSGLRNTLASSLSIPLLRNADTFEQVRRTTIVHSIEDELGEVINTHNRVARKLGVHYTFTLPVIPQEDWNNTIDDVGILVFLQGIPAGNKYYNNYALGGGRLVKNKPVFGGKNPDSGVKYASEKSCQLPYLQDEVFGNARDAAAAGYFEAVCREEAP
ncbi:hypothetical protein DFP94_1011137 [Fontibacillus phaseoli]|uniref:Uncharacterized protein n=1 Tax=Fontibacillus phaseoli TaxID=1416533 RepID=A0A369BS85_9BACL|nr:hypothetical protein [Fontibacillus phaseoli]RCX23538.1 hypothetical protein DFP94_1011137 [Fontibacillus phaseoli]